MRDRAPPSVPQTVPSARLDERLRRSARYERMAPGGDMASGVGAITALRGLDQAPGSRFEKKSIGTGDFLRIPIGHLGHWRALRSPSWRRLGAPRAWRIAERQSEARNQGLRPTKDGDTIPTARRVHGNLRENALRTIRRIQDESSHDPQKG